MRKMGNIGIILNNFYEQNILTYIKMYQEYPIKLISLIIDVAIVVFLAYELLRIVKDSRAWQLVKGIAFLVIATALSGVLNLYILNYILSTVMDWGVILIIIIFQPEIRRALEQLGGTNKFSRFFGFDKDIITKTKEDIYKVVIAVYELAKKQNLDKVHLTTRQAIQLHSLSIDGVCDTMEEALKNDIFTRGGGGNFPRNVSISPLSLNSTACVFLARV